MRFAIVGAGGIAGLRRAAIEALEGASLAGAFDVAPERAAALAGGGTAFPSLEAVVASPDVDAVVVCTPPDTHAAISLAALGAGKHVIVEKPMAPTVEECRRMAEAARAAGRTLTVGFNHRYFPAVKAVRAAILSGRLGELSHVRGYSGHTGLSEFKAPWMYSKDVMGGGALLDNGIHMIDLVHHLMGPVTGVQGLTTDRTWGLDRVEDNGFALLRGAGGVVGSLGASWTEWKGYGFFVEAYGTRGMARASYAPMAYSEVTMDRPGGARRRRRDLYPRLILVEKLRGWQSTAIQTFVEEMRDFTALATGGGPAGVVATAGDGVRSLEIAQGVYESAASGRMVELAREP